MANGQTAAVAARAIDPSAAEALCAGLIQFLETGDPPAGLFRPDAFCDLTVPQWRLQFEGADAIVDGRRRLHPPPGRVPRWRCDPTPSGFVVEVEERWHDRDGDWYCRELMRADVVDGAIAALSVYCTGDWDEARVARHAREVSLSRP